MSGTSGESKRLESIKIKVTNHPKVSGGICYITHVQTYGWQGDENNRSTWKKDGEAAGTFGEAKRLESIRIALYGGMAEQYDVYYRVHAQSFGWLGWAKNGAASGTAGGGKRLEGIQIVLVEKGGAAPATSFGGCTQNDPESFKILNLAPKHVHTWSTRTVTDQEAWDEQVCTKEAYDEKVLVKDAWDEQVPEYDYEDSVRYYCVKCNTEMSEHGVCPACGYGGCWNETCREQVLVGYTTVHHDAEYKTVHHDAEYTTKHHDAVTHTETYCSECGATK